MYCRIHQKGAGTEDECGAGKVYRKKSAAQRRMNVRKNGEERRNSILRLYQTGEG